MRETLRTPLPLLEVLVEVTKMTRVPFSDADAVLSAARAARLGEDYGITGAVATAAKAANVRPPIMTTSPPEVIQEVGGPGPASNEGLIDQENAPYIDTGG